MFFGLPARLLLVPVPVPVPLPVPPALERTESLALNVRVNRRPGWYQELSLLIVVNSESLEELLDASESSESTDRSVTDASSFVYLCFGAGECCVRRPKPAKLGSPFGRSRLVSVPDTENKALAFSSLVGKKHTSLPSLANRAPVNMGGGGRIVRCPNASVLVGSSSVLAESS